MKKPKELIIPLPNGGSLRCGPGREHEWGDYLRICDQRGREILYWDVNEWEQDAEEVIGAVFSAALKPIKELEATLQAKAKETVAKLGLSWSLKRLLMAEVDNVEGDQPATLRSALESLESGYIPFDGFDYQGAKKELEVLIERFGEDKEAEELISKQDWERRAKSFAARKAADKPRPS